MKKEAVFTNESLLKRNRELRSRYTSPLIKWYQTTMTKEQKFKMGLMSYDEFMEWQEELAEEQAREAQAAEQETKEPELSSEELEPTSENTSENEDSEETVGHTFWENDDGDRENISKDSYAQFLAENGLDVSNRSHVNIDELLNENAG